MDQMFWATPFNQNLSTWCVTNVQEEPYQFANDLEVSNRPVWGSCPPETGTLINSISKDITSNWNAIWPTEIGKNYRLEITANVSWGTYCPDFAYDPAYVNAGFYGTSEPTKRAMLCDQNMYSSIFCENPDLRPTPDVYDGEDHSYDYNFTASSNQIEVGFYDNILNDNCGNLTYKLYKISN